jgi:hypothetical protein
MFGLCAPEDDPATAGPLFRPGAAVRVQHGAVAFSLAPRQLKVAGALGALR